MFVVRCSFAVDRCIVCVTWICVLWLFGLLVVVGYLSFLNVRCYPMCDDCCFGVCCLVVCCLLFAVCVLLFGMCTRCLNCVVWCCVVLCGVVACCLLVVVC